MNSRNKPMIECRREFKLRQQYPSMIKKNKSVGKTVVINALLQSLLPAITKFKLKKNEQTKNGFHKFRLKLPSGKDLGECNVQILPNKGNILKDKIETIINQNKCKPFNKSIVLLNTMSKNGTKSMIGNIPLQCTNSVVQKNVESPNMEYLHKVFSNIKDNNIEAKNNNIERVLETNEQSTNEDSFVELSDYLSFSRPAEIANNNSLFPVNKVPNNSINASGVIAKTIEKNSNMANSSCPNDHQFDKKKILYFSSVKHKCGDQFCEKKTNKTDLESDKYNLTQEIVNPICNKSISDHKTINTENVMAIVHDNEKSSSDNDMKTVHLMNGKTINNRNHKICNDINNSIVTARNFYENLKSQDFFPSTFQVNENQNNIEQNIGKSSEEKHADENAILKKKCSCCSVLKEVTSIIRNESIKVKALKACADCAIEKGQQILLDVPKDMETVSDIKVQTESYLIPESDNFLNIKENSLNAVEMTPKELDFVYTPENFNLNSLHYIPFHNNSIFSPFNPLEESDMLVDKSIDGDVINDICNKHSTANKVKEVLSQPNVSCNKLFEQLQRDFETIRNWDENGMLNIHKAVIGNRINDVQRYLMVLKACNIDVDIPTQSEMTSLELAIKYNASTEIVKLLLEAGANPAPSQPIHDSALIIASRKNSALLPLLINYVPSGGSLDYTDFTGFAALHYCAQHGNLVGINSLINMGADVNLQERRSGRTPLFLAIENNHPAIAEKLIQNGAQANIPNFSRQTVMSLIERIKHLSLVTMLHSIS